MNIPKQALIMSLFILAAFLAGAAEARVIEECVYLVPAGKVDKKVLEKLKEKLPGSFPMTMKAVFDPQREIAQAAYDPSRRQYSARAIIDDISRQINLAIVNERALIVTEADLYEPDLNFVFGLADAKKGICIISLARLKNEFYGLKPDEKLLYARALKEAAHELAHSWKLEHCPNPKCAMFFSNSLADTDRKRDSFCYKCRIALENRNGVRGLMGKK
jgi:archaemetzincin